MTSGIYKLTFPSGNTYIGKSINIENRWKQHFDKMNKRTAAALMQAEFNIYGYPECAIVFECHDDHIDLVEACFINRVRPKLNGTYPDDPFKGITEGGFDSLMGFLSVSTLDHISTICGLKEDAHSQASLIEKVQLSNNTLMISRSEEEVKHDVHKRIKSLTNSLKERESSISKLEESNKLMKAKLAYLTKPWWEKLFN